MEVSEFSGFEMSIIKFSCVDLQQAITSFLQ